MPIYEYECRNCGRRTEALQKIDDPPLTTCDVCEGELKKLISSPAFQFKGSGWYVTDYARKGESGGKSEGAEGSKGASESSGSSEKSKSSSDSSGDSSKGSSAAPSKSSGTSGD